MGDKCALCGDVMLDLLLRYVPHLDAHPLASAPYALVTLHRAENTDDPQRLARFVRILERLPLPVIFPVHPRLKAMLSVADRTRIERMKHVRLMEACEYAEMLALERDAKMILTDSGGVQKEAYFLAVPCLTLRDETEWVETLEDGWNRVVGMDADSVHAIVTSLLRGNGCVPRRPPNLEKFGSGKAAEASIEAISNFVGRNNG